MAVIAFPLFLLISTRSPGLIIIGVLLIALAHCVQYGPQAAYIAESFPTRLGYAGSGLGYQAASLIASGPAPLLAIWLLARYGWQAISVYLIACAVLTLGAAACCQTGARRTCSRPRPRRRPGSQPGNAGGEASTLLTGYFALASPA